MYQQLGLPSHLPCGFMIQIIMRFIQNRFTAENDRAIRIFGSEYSYYNDIYNNFFNGTIYAKLCTEYKLEYNQNITNKHQWVKTYLGGIIMPILQVQVSQKLAMI